jgi:hypothetical protein
VTNYLLDSDIDAQGTMRDSLWRFPVFDQESGDPGKFTRIVSNQGQLPTQRNGSDHQIIWADRCARYR